MKLVSRPMALLALAVAAYGAAVIYFEKTYVDPRPTGRKVRILSPPFERSGPLFFVKYGVQAEPGSIIYENREPLDPLKEYRGAGFFRILPNGIEFSSTDGTDPNDSRHRYWLVLP